MQRGRAAWPGWLTSFGSTRASRQSCACRSCGRPRAGGSASAVNDERAACEALANAAGVLMPGAVRGRAGSVAEAPDGVVVDASRLVMEERPTDCALSNGEAPHVLGVGVGAVVEEQIDHRHLAEARAMCSASRAARAAKADLHALR